MAGRKPYAAPPHGGGFDCAVQPPVISKGTSVRGLPSRHRDTKALTNGGRHVLTTTDRGSHERGTDGWRSASRAATRGEAVVSCLPRQPWSRRSWRRLSGSRPL